MTQGFFSDIPAAQPDPILGITEAFRADPAPNKVNLGVGVYQDANGRVPILNCVKRAAEIWLKKEDTKTYIPIEGSPEYNTLVQQLVFGADSQALADKRVTTLQTIGGSGALKLGIDFLKRFFPESKVHISDPSWENHRVLLEAGGFEVHTYPYYDPATRGLKVSAMLEYLSSLPAKSIVLLHVSCHNPTGVDIDTETWKSVIEICNRRALIPFLDCAYQGFAEGLEADAAPVREFAESGISFLLAASFSKSLGLYRERVGSLSVVSDSAATAKNLMTQIKRVVRSIYSSPPSYGGNLATIILADPELRAEWIEELDGMRNRILEMRSLFVERLKVYAPDQDFSFILRQRGMFSYSGLSVEIMRTLREKNHIYGLDSGRICVAAMNRSNIDNVCSAIATTLKAA